MIYRLSILVVLATGLIGCEFDSEDPAAPQVPPAQSADAARIAQLEDEVRIRDRQIDELRIRANRLARRVREVEFLNEQLGRQLDAVGDAPRQRDLYKRQAAERQLEIDRLRRRFERLRRAMGVTTSQPATAPTSAPAARPDI
jgi:predicted RNase H-like nuclease (RuvC/YqgF family)